jgi:hypothetical protein
VRTKRSTPAYVEALKARIAAGPADHPVITAVRCGDTGTVWIRPDVEPGAIAVEWMLLDHDGVPHGRVPLPTNARIEAIRGRWVALAEEMESGEERLVVRSVPQK